MTIRNQILSSHETLSDFAWAADARFREVEELLSASQFSGAVYLSGLACEMWLKLAAIRCLNAQAPLSSAVTGHLPLIRRWMTANFPAITAEHFHTLEFWAEYIIRFRAGSGRALPAAIVGQIRHHVVGRLFEDWKIDLRYRSILISERHAWRVFHDLWWVKVNWTNIWR